MKIKKKYTLKKVDKYVLFLGLYFICLVLGVMAIGSIGSLLRIIGFLPIIIWFIYSRKIKLSRILFCTIPFILWVFFSILWSIDMNATYKRSITFVSFLLLLLTTSTNEYSDIELSFLKKCIVWSSRITAIVVLFFSSYSSGRLLLSGILNENPNYLCAYFIFGLINAVLFVLSKKNKLKFKILHIIEIIIYIYIIFSTGSRGGMLSCVTSMFIAIILYKEKNSVWNKEIIKKVLMVIVIFIVFDFIIDYIPSEISTRFNSSAIIESNGTGRYSLWRDCISSFQNSSLLREIFGYGAATIRKITYLFSFEIHNVSQNIYIENLVELGVCGLIFYLLHISSFLVSSYKSRDVFSFSIIVGFMIFGLSSSIYSFKPYWNIMLYIVCISKRK